MEAAKCSKLTDLFGAGVTTPAGAAALGDERRGLDDDERVEADMLSNVSLGLATFLRHVRNKVENVFRLNVV